MPQIDRKETCAASEIASTSTVMSNTLKDRLNNNAQNKSDNIRIKLDSSAYQLNINGTIKTRKQMEQEKTDAERSALDTLDEEFELEELEDKADEEKKRRLQKIGAIIMSAVVVYLIILIYGVLVTDFTYDNKGEIEPVISSVQDISEKSDFNVVLSAYTQVRTVYENILTLDYRVAKQEEDTTLISPDYTKTLDVIDSLMTELKALNANAEYTQLVSLMNSFCDYMALYCQYMANALSLNDAEAGNNAISVRSNYIQPYFQQITQNIITFGQNIKGVDLTDVKQWNAESYIQETIEGISGK